MKKNKGFPFYRNRYYSGKLLCSSDFISEQRYFNQKRHFLSRLTHGYGILCGLNVAAADSLSILIESGAALDILGREIVVEKQLIKRISVIDGFEDTQTEQLTLCICYEETPQCPVHVPVKEDAEGDVECNSIKEGYRMFLLDRKQARENPELTDSMVGETVLFEDQDFKVSLKMPAVISSTCSLRADAVMEKKSHARKQLTFQCQIQTPGLLADSGQRQIEVRLQSGEMEKGGQQIQSVSLHVEDRRKDSATILVKACSLSAVIDGISSIEGQDIMIPMEISNRLPEEIVSSLLTSVSLENVFEKMEPEYIQLADILVSRTRDTCMIEQVTRPSCLKTVHTAAGDAQARKALAYYVRQVPGEGQRIQPAYHQEPKDAGVADRIPRSLQPEGDDVTSGICEIPVGIDGKAGAVFFSDEIMHKQGRGDVCVQIAYEFVENDGIKGVFSRKTVYGDMDIFGKLSGRMPQFRWAVMVNSHRGTFTVGIKLLEPTHAVLIPVRWFAFRAQDSDRSLLSGQGADQQIIAMPSTVILHPKESVFIGAEFRNMEPVSYRYDLLEGEAGEITSDGIYTAPAREGVFEITITCIDNPEICTYAYAVVKRSQEKDDNN